MKFSEKKINLWVMRHGQPVPGAPPDYDPALSELGRMQVARSADFVLRSGFSGRLMVSPYRRTIQCGQCAAEVLGIAEFPVVPLVQEFIPYGRKPYARERTLEEMHRENPMVSLKSQLAPDWMVCGPETMGENVVPRLRVFIENLLENSADGAQVLVITHDAVQIGFYMLFTGKTEEQAAAGLPVCWNGCLSEYIVHERIQDTEICRLNHVEFLSDEMLTVNQKKKDEVLHG